MLDMSSALKTRHISRFEKSDFYTLSMWKEPTFTFLAWALPSFLFVLWSQNYAPDVEFYQNAIKEGIGPNLWNLIGSLALFMFGWSVVLSGWDSLRKGARLILLNTYSIGSLTFGLLFGQLVTNFPTENVKWWQQGLFGVTSIGLFVMLIGYNFSIWYLSFLLGDAAGNKSRFLINLEQMNFIWRAAIGLAVATLVTILFFSEK